MDWYKSQKFETKVGALFYTPRDGEPKQVKKLGFSPEGPVGDFHGGMHTNSTIREEAIVDKGSWVLNTRQVTITSQGEMDLVAKEMGIRDVRPEDLISNIHLEGMDNLSAFPAGTYVQFFDQEGNQRQLILFITGINDPCLIPRERISERLEINASGFEKAAYNHRGLISMVYRAGTVKEGDTARITTPRVAKQDQIG
jgi:MOSC domain-containing protein YiiM